MLTPLEIFLQAQQAWQARAVPQYESFRVPCDETFLEQQCRGDNVEFTVRLSDGRTFAEALSPTGGAKVLMRGGYIAGPVGTPLGFFRTLPDGDSGSAPPPNLAPDPLRTIATVTANGHVYDVKLSDETAIDGRPCYHLTLRPQLDPDRYPLRELWVDEANYQVTQLIYERPYGQKHTHALVLYRFAPVGPAQIWAIVHIEAQATTHDGLSNTTERVSRDLTGLSFPASAPNWYFQAPR